MPKHSAPSPGDKARAEKGQGLHEASEAFQVPSPEQIAADVAQIDGRTYASPPASSKPEDYQGRETSDTGE